MPIDPPAPISPIYPLAMKLSPLRLITSASLAVLALVVAVTGYRLVRAGLVETVYRDRLETLGTEYESLREHYNTAVRRTAVTELLVTDDTPEAPSKVTVRVRTSDGTLATIDTPYRAGAELYVDAVVVDGRLWIRRVFDARTPPEQGVVIDPALAGIDWAQSTTTIGKAVYRGITPGRWVVSVSGDGSLTLVRNDDDDDIDLARGPEVIEFGEFKEKLEQDIAKLGAKDIWASVVGEK